MSIPMMTHEQETMEDDLPQHVADEMATLGAILLDGTGDTLDVVAGIARPEHFHSPIHQVIYQAALDLRRRSMPVDPITVAGELAPNSEWQRSRGDLYLPQLLRMCPTATNADFYASRVVAAARTRLVGQLGQQLVHHAETAVGAATEDAQQVYESARMRIEQFEQQMPTRSMTSLGDAFQQAVEEAEAVQSGAVRGVPTGFTDFDAITGGLPLGNISLFGARPGVGKSAAVLNVAANIGIRGGQRALIVSVEMSTLEIAQRMACSEARVRISDMRQGRLEDSDWTRLARAQAAVSEAPIDVVADPAMTISAITSAVRSYQRQHPDLAVVVIDYIQRVRHDNPSGERKNDVYDISVALTELARSLNIAVVCAAQLNRNSAATEPRLHDLKESGQLEQDAAMAVLVHRPDAEPGDSPRMGEADLILAKHRFGPTSTVTMAHQMHYGRFVDMAPE